MVFNIYKCTMFEFQIMCCEYKYLNCDSFNKVERIWVDFSTCLVKQVHWHIHEHCFWVECKWICYHISLLICFLCHLVSWRILNINDCFYIWTTYFNLWDCTDVLKHLRILDCDDSIVFFQSHWVYDWIITWHSSNFHFLSFDNSSDYLYVLHCHEELVIVCDWVDVDVIIDHHYDWLSSEMVSTCFINQCRLSNCDSDHLDYLVTFFCHDSFIFRFVNDHDDCFDLSCLIVVFE